MKKSISFLMLFFFLFSFADDLNAQSRKRRKSRKKQREEESQKPPFKDKLVYEIGFGNPSFIAGNGSSQFNIAFKPSVGYKVFPRLTAGPFFKMDYIFVNNFGQEYNILDYGTGIYSRFKIIDALYIKGEAGLTSFALNSQLNVLDRKALFHPLAGLGYVSGQNNWTYGLEFLFTFRKEVRDYSGRIGEIWIKIDYNF